MFKIVNDIRLIDKRFKHNLLKILHMTTLSNSLKTWQINELSILLSYRHLILLLDFREKIYLKS